jgi:hypothetical protein
MKAARPPGLLVLAVLGLHLLLGREVDRIHDGWLQDQAAPMPPRLQVDFVREMTMAPPAAPRAAARPPARRSPPKAVPSVAPAPASAPDQDAGAAPEVASDAASAAAVVAQAASVPEDLPAAATAASAVATDEPGPEWPLSTRLTYLLTGYYRGPLEGSAQVEWLRQGRDYQVHLDVDLGLISRRMSSQGVLTPDGISPQRYDEQTKLLLMDPRRAQIQFLGSEVQLATGQREALARGAQDSASQFVQLTWLFLTVREPLQAGHSVSFPLVLPRRQYAWRYDVVGEEVVDTPMGPVASWHLKPAPVAAGGDLLAEVWLAPTLQYLPVRILIRQNAETHLDLVLKRAPLQAAPESTDSPIPRRSAR